MKILSITKQMRRGKVVLCVSIENGLGATERLFFPWRGIELTDAVHANAAEMMVKKAHYGRLEYILESAEYELNH